MARPQKKGCDWFIHDATWRNKPEQRAIRNKFKAEGFGVWVMLWETLTQLPDNCLVYNDRQIELTAGDFAVSSDLLREIIEYAIKLDMLTNDNNVIYSPELKGILQPVYDKREKLKNESANQDRDDNGQFAKPVKKRSPVQPETTRHIPVEELDKRSEKFKEEVKSFSSKYDKELLKAFYDYWSELDKSKTKMRFEMEKTWETSKRLTTWNRNNFKH